jgi:hypothetical protein
MLLGDVSGQSEHCQRRGGHDFFFPGNEHKKTHFIKHTHNDTVNHQQNDQTKQGQTKNHTTKQTQSKSHDAIGKLRSVPKKRQTAPINRKQWKKLDELLVSTNKSAHFHFLLV